MNQIILEPGADIKFDTPESLIDTIRGAEPLVIFGIHRAHYGDPARSSVSTEDDMRWTMLTTHGELLQQPVDEKDAATLETQRMVSEAQASRFAMSLGLTESCLSLRQIAQG